ncbi:MAG TPA: alpha/beta fold hydrolase [Stellaceae bacterium]|nr:alpha/beta fold hydrolase [Stellaceae bacterium]
MPKELDDRRNEASFVLIPGAGGMAWYWHRVTPLLEQAHHEAIAIDLPGDDGAVGLDAYADIVIRAIGERPNVVLVAQSLGGFTAPLVCARRAVKMLVLVNAMIPQPGETPAAWWGNTGAVAARVAAATAGGYSAEFDLSTYFLHDVPDWVLRHGPSRQRDQAEAIFSQPCRFDHWPRIPIRVIASAEDRFFPLEFQRRVAGDRLSTEVDAIPGGHLVALSHPKALADRLLRLSRDAL